jgi:plasmid stability protein
MVDVLIRDVPEDVVEALKERAREHNRSLQGELRELLVRSAAEPRVDAVALAREARRRIEEEWGVFEDESAEIVRVDRDAR